MARRNLRQRDRRLGLANDDYLHSVNRFRPVTGPIVYVSQQFSGSVTAHRLDTNSGELSEVGRYDIGGNVMPLAIAPDKRSLYAVRRSDPPLLVSFSIEPRSGALTKLAETPALAGYVHVCTDRTGKYLFGLSHTDHYIVVHPIQNGIAGPAVQAKSTGGYPHGTAVDPGNRFVAVTCLGDDCVVMFELDEAAGRLESLPMNSVDFGAESGPRHLCYTKSGAVIYVVCELSGTLERLRCDPWMGAVHRMDSIRIIEKDLPFPVSAADIALSADERFIYVSERATNQIVCVENHAETGSFRIVQRTATAAEPRGIAIDPSGAWLLAGGQYSESVSIFSLDKDSGRMTPCAPSLGHSGPNWIEIVDVF